MIVPEIRREYETEAGVHFTWHWPSGRKHGIFIPKELINGDVSQDSNTVQASP